MNKILDIGIVKKSDNISWNDVLDACMSFEICLLFIYYHIHLIHHLNLYQVTLIEHFWKYMESKKHLGPLFGIV